MIANPLFEGLSPQEIEKVQEYLQLLKFEKDEAIVEEGQKAAFAFILKSGSVKVYKISVYEKDRVLDIIKPEDKKVFGLINLLDCKEVTTTIIANEPTEIYKFNHIALMEISSKYPEIANKLLFNIGLQICDIVRRKDQEVKVLFDSIMKSIDESI